MKYADSITRSFLSYSSPAWRDAYATQRPNKFADYQDPTYIGFYVRFPQLGVQGEGERPVDDLSINKSLDTLGGGLFFHESHPDSAIRYLKSIGEYTRAQMIRELIQGLYELQKMPWYIQKVSGLEEIWKIDPEQSFRGKDKKITFETLESIDLKMTYLMDLYRKAAFDAIHMRWMLPSNLRSFKMELVITEIRSMQRPSSVLPATNSPNLTSDISEFENPIKPPPFGNISIPGLTEQGIQNAISAVVPNSQWASGLSSALISTLQRDPGAFSDYPVIMQDFNNLATFVRFRFEKCKFDINSDAPTYFGSLTKSPEAAATNKMTILTPVIREYNSYGLLGAILEDTYDQTWRNENAVAETFYDPSNPPQGVIGIERDFLDGVKREFFNQTERLKNQQKLKEANARLGGLLGGLLDTALDIGTGALNNAIQGAISRAVLGNVFEGVFPPPIADDIATTVTLNAPPLITNLIADVILESSGSTLEGGIQPENSGLTGAEPNNPNNTNVELTAPVINAASSTNVALSAPPIAPATSASVDLLSPGISNPQSTNVELAGPPVGPPLASKVIFVEPPKSESASEKVKLEGLEPMDINPGSVDLRESSVSNSSATKVELDGPESTASNPGSVELEGTTVEGGGTEKVQFTSPRLNNDIENSVQLEGPQINAGGGSVELEEPSINASSPSNVSFEDNGSSIDGTGGTVDLQAAIVQPGGLTKVELQEPSISDSGSGKVELQSPPVVAADSATVNFIEPPKTQNNLQPVQFEEPSKSNSVSTKVNFVEAKPNEGELQKVTQEGPRIPEIELGAVDFEGTQSERSTPGTVIFKEPSLNDEDPGRVSQDAPKIPVIELDSIELVGPDTGLEGELGVVPQVSPPENNTAPTIKTNLEAPSTPLDINRIGNADLQAP
jgi:hypothetical protein